MNPLVSVVVPTFNRVGVLKDCLNALESQQLDRGAFEILVIDDGSTDDTTSLLEKKSRTGSAKLRWFRQSHRGPAAARNFGITEALGSLIAFTDDDCVPTNEWLEALAHGLQENATCAGIGGPIRRLRDSLVSRFIDGANFVSHWIEGDNVEYLVTANALFRTSCLREIGGFDPSFSLAGGEDVDLSYRLRNAGYELRVSDRGVVRHHHPESLRGLYRMSWRHGYGACFLARQGLVPPQKTHFRSLGAQLLRTVARPIPAGAQNGVEAVIWRGLSLIPTIGKFSGYRAGLRQIHSV